MKTSQSSFRRSSSVLSVIFVCLLFISSCNTNSTSKEDKISQETTTVSNSDTNIDENSYSIDSNSNAINNEQQPNSIRPVYSNNDSDDNTNINEQDLYAEFSAQDSSEFFQRFAPKTQTFKISNNEEQDIYCDLGTYIHIEEGSFVFLDGSPVTTPINFEVKEFYDKKTVLLAGLATQTKDGFLESGGMLHLEATSDGKKVKLQKKIAIEMPTFNTNTRSKNGMKVYLASNSKTNSNTANLNNVNNPPSIWQTDGTEIGIVSIPEKRDFYKLRFLYKKDSLDAPQTNTNDCECADVNLISEKIEALSEEIDVEKSKEYLTTFRTIKPTTSNRRVITPTIQSTFSVVKDTVAYENYKSYQMSFFENPNQEDIVFYDTIQLAIEISKKGTAKVIEEITKTNNGLKNTSVIRSVNSSGGLRFSVNTSKSGICKGQKIAFYLQSVGLWEDVLEKGENQFRSWRSSQRKSDENYTISYKKRKKPILVWTGIIKTTRKAFVEDYRMTRALKYYHRTPNVRKQVAYDAYRQKYIDRYEQYVAKNKATLETTQVLDSYVFQTMDLGWINCDRFYGVPNTQKVNLLVNSHTPVRVIFNDINAVMRGTQTGKYNTFSSIPKGERITIFGVRKKGEKLFMAFEKVRVGKNPVDLVYRETTLEEIEKTLANL
ncbi:hypothetical protein ACE193_01030 [Bernardetia sp. OM2101]|uniref:hypothetical protein n=1 Tax=Bernardetia sp. OM2101 TaxID=3344876 RepID=UPI0035CEDA6A